jgi:hypothetical protein
MFFSPLIKEKKNEGQLTANPNVAAFCRLRDILLIEIRIVLGLHVLSQTDSCCG